MAEPEGLELDAGERERIAGMRFAICRGTFYADLAEALQAGALAGFADAGLGGDAVETFDVPGAYDLPLAAKLCAESGRFAGIACLGAVIRGETDHYDYVCGESARGIQEVNLQTGVPCTFGVLTCKTMDQARARAGGVRRDTGRAAAHAAVRMALLAGTLRS